MISGPEVAMPVLDAKALDADPEGAALLHSVLNTGPKRCVVRAQTFPEQRKGEERAENTHGQTASARACET